MENPEHKVRASFRLPPVIAIFQGHVDFRKAFYRLITFSLLTGLWQIVALRYHNTLVLPSPLATAKAFLFAIFDTEILLNLLLTLKRVGIGLSIAMVIGLSLGFLMGYFKIANKLIDPVIGPLRQVPIMAWVPLTIVWFGLGDGPTLFLIAMVGVFPIILNTISGVRAVPLHYYHAARSMGAGRWSLFTRVTIPASLPDIMTGVRIALSAGWMSVI